MIIMKRLETAFSPESKYRPFFLSVMTFSLAYGLYKGVIDNYLAEIVGMSAFDKGVSEFFREIPGLLLVFILAALYTFSAERIYKLGAPFSIQVVFLGDPETICISIPWPAM